MPRSRLIALASTAGVLVLAACAGGAVNTDAGPAGPSNASSTTPTTRNSAKADPKAALIGGLIEVNLTVPTTAPVATTPATDPGATTPSQQTTPQQTQPQQTQPQQTQPQQTQPQQTIGPNTTTGGGKPAPAVIGLGVLNSEEQQVFAAVNNARTGPDVQLENAATAAARTHSDAMAAAGAPIQIADLFSSVNAGYTGLTAIVVKGSNLQLVLSNLTGDNGAGLQLNFQYVGIGLKSSGGNLYLTVILGS